MKADKCMNEVETTSVLRNSSPPLRSRSRHVEFTGRENGGNDFLQCNGTRLTSSRQVYVDFLVKSEWSSEFMNEL